MFIKPNPPGVNKPQPSDRMHIVKVVSGDVWKLDARVFNPSNGVPANYRNTRVRFVLSENKFNYMPLWVGEWSKGVFLDSVVPGLCHIEVPECVSNKLRRGTYAFSLAVTDIDGRNQQTQLSGYFEVEYEPSSSEHDIPYREDSDLDKYVKKLTDEQKEQLLAVLEEIKTGKGSIGNIEDGVRYIAQFLIDDCSGGDDPTPPGPEPEPEPETIEKSLSNMATSIDDLVDVVKDAIEKQGQHKPCPCPCPHPPKPPKPPIKPFILRPPWYHYPRKPG